MSCSDTPDMVVLAPEPCGVARENPNIRPRVMDPHHPTVNIASALLSPSFSNCNSYLYIQPAVHHHHYNSLHLLYPYNSILQLNPSLLGRVVRPLRAILSHHYNSIHLLSHSNSNPSCSHRYPSLVGPLYRCNSNHRITTTQIHLPWFWFETNSECSNLQSSRPCQ